MMMEFLSLIHGVKVKLSNSVKGKIYDILSKKKICKNTDLNHSTLNIFVAIIQIQIMV